MTEPGAQESQEALDAYIGELTSHGCMEHVDFFKVENYQPLLFKKHLAFIFTEKGLLPVDGNLIRVGNRILLSPVLQELLLCCSRRPPEGWLSVNLIRKTHGGSEIQFSNFLKTLPTSHLNHSNRRPYLVADTKLGIYYSREVQQEYRKFLGKPPLE